MIKNIVFDIGNVLVSFKPDEFVEGKLIDKQIAQRVCDCIFKGEDWLMLDRGLKTEEEAVRDFCLLDAEISEHVQNVMKDWHEMLTPIDETVEILKKLKAKGYKLYYLSNYQVAAFEYISRYEFFNLFDGGILSCNVKLLKPEKEIYEKLTEVYGIRPEESVFVDDTLVNVQGAEKLGFVTVNFKGCDDLKRKLAEFNVNIE
jgi:haloacid dehalogenase superfamily, subfamily IA, variant 3 with third motif having DD or ED